MTAAALVAALVAGLFFNVIIIKVAAKLARRKRNPFYESILNNCRGPLRAIFPLLFIGFTIMFLELPVGLHRSLESIISILLVASLAWLFVRSTAIFEDFAIQRMGVKDKDDPRARKIHTEIRIIKHILMFAIIIFAGANILLGFEEFRQIGATLLASAGLIGLVVGIAARSTVGNLIAGIQIALAQPIRLEDVVIVENEWGWIEEITLTYVVVRIWDLRRLVLPISYFIEKPFQNWTLTSPDLMGTVGIFTDYTVPVQEIREELTRILKESRLWDGKVNVMQVTHATENVMKLRALVSAANSGLLWDLRCEVREKLVYFIQKNYPEALPKIRTEIESFPKNELRSEELRKKPFL
ncbi:MAG: mechanosensitive ion channel [Nitrospiraceae bacterium]|nr:mechanosensitive ion channel [Nitrospiraceae bacterium]